uniref:Uncharacterized protein n=1 Tax=Mycena chlorophos TaxID=658473 RepID=A0ABQ0KYE3_MYCCL|nr:predicted protein [Mycena chlorophos]
MPPFRFRAAPAHKRDDGAAISGLPERYQPNPKPRPALGPLLVLKLRQPHRSLRNQLEAEARLGEDPAPIQTRYAIVALDANNEEQLRRGWNIVMVWASRCVGDPRRMPFLVPPSWSDDDWRVGYTCGGFQQLERSLCCVSDGSSDDSGEWSSSDSEAASEDC